MKLRFRYTLAGEQHIFDIKPRNTGAVIPLTNVGAHYSMQTYGDKQYIAPDTWYGSGYFSLNTYNAAVQSLVSREFAVDPWNLRESDMYYDHSKAMADLTKDDGQAMTYDGSTGTLNFCAFIRTEYPGGEPTPHWYIGGLTDVSPTGTSPSFPAFGATTNGIYGTDPMPCIDFALVTVTDNGVNYPCLLVSIIPNREFSPVYVQTYLFDGRLFEGAAAKPAPPDQRGNVTPWGYTGSWNYTSTSDTVEAPTGYSFVNRWAHGIRLYWVNDNNVEGLMQDLYGETLIDMLNSAKYKLITGIICLHKIPLTPDHGTTESPTIFGKRLGSNLLNSCSKITKQVYTIEGSPVTLEGISQSAFDYSRYSSLHVRLPFIGTVPIDIDAVMDGTIRTVYHIDILTGNCMAQVFCRNSSNGAEILLFQGGGNCAIPIPYSGNDQGGMKQLGSYLGLAGGVVAGALTGGSAAPVIGSAASAFMIGAPAATTAQYTPTEISTLGSKKVCYILETHKPLLTDTYSSVNGFPASSGAAADTVSAYSGSGLLTGLLHADISGATDNEKAAIEAAFKEGVIV